MKLKAFLLIVIAISVYIYNIDVVRNYYFQDFKNLKPGDTWRNWGNIHTCKPLSFHQPQNEHEIVEIVKEAAKNNHKVKVVGSGHSWMNITCAQSDVVMINFDNYQGFISVDTEKKTATMETGITLEKIFKVLDKYNLQLPVTTFPIYFTLGGLISTGSHGMVTKLGSISSLVTEMWIIVGNGSVVYTSQDTNTNLFKAAQTGVGAMGIISRATIRLVDRFNISTAAVQLKKNNLENEMIKFFEDNDQGYVTWLAKADVCLALGMNHTHLPHSGHWEKHYSQSQFVLHSFWPRVLTYLNSYPNVIQWLLETIWMNEIPPFVGPSKEQMSPGHYFDMTSEIEYMVPTKNFVKAFKELGEKLEKYPNWITILAGRPVKGDDIWISPFYEQDSISIEVELISNPHNRIAFENLVFEIFLKHGGRPHWGKQFHYKNEKEIEEIYPKWNQWKKVREEIDPKGIFLSQFWQEIINKKQQKK